MMHCVFNFLSGHDFGSVIFQENVPMEIQHIIGKHRDNAQYDTKITCTEVRGKML